MAERLQQTAAHVTNRHTITTELVPYGFSEIYQLLHQSENIQKYIQLIHKKEQLNQDVFLIGTSGPLRRWVALYYCAKYGREVEYISLTRDITESDLKQRRELTNGKKSIFVNQGVVNAALHGRVLIIEGLEFAERNVLPVLNNLLENREMALEDGSFLLSPERYDELMRDGKVDVNGNKNESKLKRVHENFRVIAIGVPVPPCPGNPLDPPLRSRFQAIRINQIEQTHLLNHFFSIYKKLENYFTIEHPQGSKMDGKEMNLLSLSQRSIARTIGFANALTAIGYGQAEKGTIEYQEIAYQHMRYLSESTLLSAVKYLYLFPYSSVGMLLTSTIYPYKNALSNQSAIELYEKLLSAVTDQDNKDQLSSKKYILSSIGYATQNSSIEGDHLMKINFHIQDGPEIQLSDAREWEGVEFSYPIITGGLFNTLSGSLIISNVNRKIQNVYSTDVKQLLSSLVQSHIVGKDICMIGEKGEGKTFIINQLAELLGYEGLETVFIYKDMTSRDLLQKRTTSNDGSTIWVDSSLVNGLKEGKLVVLDGIHRLPIGSFNVLLRLVYERECQLFDGTRLIHHQRFESLKKRLNISTTEMIKEKKIFPIHPSFRLIAIAAPASLTNPWLTDEIMQMFHFYTIDLYSNNTINTNYLSTILRGYAPDTNDSILINSLINKLENLLNEINKLNNDPLIKLEEKLSLRQLIRIFERTIKYPDDLFDSIYNNLMLSFLPVQKRDYILNILDKLEIKKIKDSRDCVDIESTEEQLRIGKVVYRKTRALHPTLVPKVLFYNIAKHTFLLESLLKDILLNENLLLIGNQGVGKNKLIDRILELMNKEREYIQLHRDTTIQSLTILPTLEEGKIIWYDSPLVRAMMYGRVLMIDEADKAPIEVVCILKGLIADGEILLSDGRRFVSKKSLKYKTIFNTNANLTNNLAVSNPTDYAENQQAIFPIHDNFLLIALANRPGYPFLGNDFFGELGDIFSCHIIDNPDEQSEFQLLKSYGPTVNDEIIKNLIYAFNDLREMVSDGTLSYPYSTRELINIVKHLEKYPKDNLSDVLNNILAFDSYDEYLMKSLYEIFHRYGIPLYIPTVLNELHGNVKNNNSENKSVKLALKIKFKALKVTGELEYDKVVFPKYFQVSHQEEFQLNEFVYKNQHERPKKWEENQIEWKGVDKKYSMRGKDFTEEIMNIKSEEEVKGECYYCVSDVGADNMNYLHVVSNSPFNLYTFQLVNNNKILLSKMNILQTIISYWSGDNKFLPAPCIYFNKKQHKFFIFEVHFSILLVIDPYTQEVQRNSMHAITNHPPDPFFNERVPSAPKFLYFSENSDLFILYFENQTELIFVLAQKECKIKKFVLPESGKIRSIHWMYENELIVSTDNGRLFICQFQFSTWEQFNTIHFFKVFYKARVGAAERMDFEDCYYLPRINHDNYKIVISGQSLQFQSQASIPSPTGLEIPKNKQPFQYAAAKPLEVVDAHIFTSANALFGVRVNFTRLSTQKETRSYKETISQVFIIEREESLLGKRNKLLHKCSLLINEGNKLLLVNALTYEEKSLLEVIDILHSNLRVITVASTLTQSRFTSHFTSKTLLRNSVPAIVALRLLNDGKLVVIQEDGLLRLFELRDDQLSNQLDAWKIMNFGDQALPRNSEGEEGNEFEENQVQSNSNSDQVTDGAGNSNGNGGRSLPGTGNAKGNRKIRPLDDFNFDNPFEDEEANKARNTTEFKEQSISQKTIEEVIENAYRASRRAVSKQLNAENNSVGLDENVYKKLYEAVASEILQLRLILESAEARERERVWIKNQTQGELDDNRLIDGATGEKTIFKKRGNEDFLFGGIQKKPKRIRFVMDVSASMSRFNSSDRRLDRLAATTCMIMESFHNFTHKYDYSIVGHDGETPLIPLVEFGKPPKTLKERLDVIQLMYWNAMFCASGDNTLAATDHAIKEVIKEEGDDYFVFVVSDANLTTYGISSESLGKVLLSDKRVNSFAIFIAGADNANWLTSNIPRDRAYIVLDTSKLPKLFKDIFTMSVLKSATTNSRL